MNVHELSHTGLSLRCMCVELGTHAENVNESDEYGFICCAVK